jgi:uncharacterized membrane protein
VVRLLVDWIAPSDVSEKESVRYDRISVPPLDENDLLDDAFIAIERDGANAVEVIVRLLRALETLSRIGNPAMRAAARRHAERMVALSEQATHLPADRELIAQRAVFT